MAIFVASFIIVTASCLGLIRLRVGRPSVERFTATDSQSRKDVSHVAQFFPFLAALQEQIIMVPNNDQNILSEDCLKEALLVNQTIVNISGYDEICFRQLLSNTQQKPSKPGCIISSPLELADAQFEDLKNISSILASELMNSTFILSTGQTFNSSFMQMLSNFQVQHNIDSLTARADALRVIYFIKNTNAEESQAVVNFETSFGSLISSLGRRLICAELSFKTGKTTNDALEDALEPKLWPLYFSPLAMALVVFIVLCFSSDNLCILKTILLTISSILFPMISSAGIVSVTNASLFPTTLFIPFLLLGKSTSDVVLLLVEWQRQKKVPSLEHRVSSCVAKAGFLAALSALYGIVLSGLAIKSSFDVISEFFLVTLVTYAVNSTASFIVTVILLMYFERRLKKLKNPCLRFRRRKSSTPESFDLGLEWNGETECQKVKLKRVLKSLTWIMASLGGKILALPVLVGIIGFCAFSALQTDDRTRTTESFLPE